MAWLIITSGSLIGNMLRYTRICRRCNCARAVPMAPVDAPMIAAGLPFQALPPWGREAQSIAFFNTPDMDQLYSGVTNRIAFASRIRLFNSVTLAGGFCSSSWLNGGMPSSSNVSTVTPFGASSVAARSAARLYDPRRRLPAIPRIRIGVFICHQLTHSALLMSPKTLAQNLLQYFAGAALW